jgi:plasmid stabilization system protein ParE
MRVRFLPKARAELKEAIAWYDHKRPGVGQRFLDVVDARLDTIRRQPERFERLAIQRLSQEIRRALVLQGFPYSIVFRVEIEEIVIIAVAHAKRRPRYWRKRLNE